MMPGWPGPREDHSGSHNFVPTTVLHLDYRGYEGVLTDYGGSQVLDLSGVFVFGSVFATLVYLFLPQRS
jgi:hypothetical protein